MIIEFSKPIPIVTENGEDGYAIYAESSGMFENDIWTCVLCDGGVIRHYSTSQVVVHKNATFEINEKVKIQDKS